jgi:hypothetical protein
MERIVTGNGTAIIKAVAIDHKLNTQLAPQQVVIVQSVDIPLVIKEQRPWVEILKQIRRVSPR